MDDRWAGEGTESEHGHRRDTLEKVVSIQYPKNWPHPLKATEPGAQRPGSVVRAEMVVFRKRREV